MLPLSHLLANSATYILGESDIRLLKMILVEGKHDLIYKASSRLIIAAIDASVHLGVNPGTTLNLLVKNDYTIEAPISGIDVLIEAIELNRKTTVNWLTSRIQSVYEVKDMSRPYFP